MVVKIAFHMPQTHPELAESLHQFITIWKMIGRRFPQVDQTDRLGLAITWPDTDFPFYNALFLTEKLMDAQVLQDKVQQAAAYLRARRNSGLFVACLDNVSGEAYAATGIRRTVLHATEAGYPLYLRLGYHPTVKFIGCMLES